MIKIDYCPSFQTSDYCPFCHSKPLFTLPEFLDSINRFEQEMKWQTYYQLHSDACQRMQCMITHFTLHSVAYNTIPYKNFIKQHGLPSVVRIIKEEKIDMDEFHRFAKTMKFAYDIKYKF